MLCHGHASSLKDGVRGHGTNARAAALGREGQECVSSPEPLEDSTPADTLISAQCTHARDFWLPAVEWINTCYFKPTKSVVILLQRLAEIISQTGVFTCRSCEWVRPLHCSFDFPLFPHPMISSQERQENAWDEAVELCDYVIWYPQGLDQNQCRDDNSVEPGSLPQALIPFFF